MSAWTSEDAEELQLAALYCLGCPVLAECGAAGDGEASGATWGAVANLPPGTGLGRRWDAAEPVVTAPPRPSAAAVRGSVLDAVRRAVEVGEAATVAAVVAATGFGPHRVRGTLLSLVDDGALAVDRTALAWTFAPLVAGDTAVSS